MCSKFNEIWWNCFLWVKYDLQKIFDQVLALNDESVSLWFNDQEHKHDNAKIKDKIE